MVRAPQESLNADLQKFYSGLLSVIKKPVFRYGNWQLLEANPVWEANGSWDAFIACSWQGADDERMLVVVNYASHSSQCYLRFPFPELDGGQWQLHDLMSEASYERKGDDLQSAGLYLDMQPWQYHVFEMNHIKT